MGPRIFACSTSLKIFVVVFYASCVIIADVLSVDWNYKNYPNPMEEYKSCKRSEPSFVCDPDEVLQEYEADDLEKLIEDVNMNTNLVCDENEIQSTNNSIENSTNSTNATIGVGYKIAVAIVNKLPYIKSRLRRQRIALKFAEILRGQWNLGECGNDMVIFLVAYTKRIYVSVGPAIKERISEYTIHRILRTPKRYVRQRVFVKGLSSIIKHIKMELVKPVVPDYAPQTPVPVWVSAIIGIIIITSCCGCCMFGVVMACRRGFTSKSKTRVCKADKLNPDEFQSLETKTEQY